MKRTRQLSRTLKEENPPKVQKTLSFAPTPTPAKLLWELKDGGSVRLIRNFLTPSEANQLQKECTYDKEKPSYINWKQEYMRIGGKQIPFPRMSAFLGEKANTCYRYSGLTKVSVPWSSRIAALKKRIDQEADQEFNVAILNYYYDGNSHMGWHSDDQKDLLENGEIASLSLGASRTFRLRHKQYHQATTENKKDFHLDVELQHGDLLLMGGTLQKYWKHCVPKAPKKANCTDPRINITFRTVVGSALSQLDSVDTDDITKCE